MRYFVSIKAQIDAEKIIQIKSSGAWFNKYINLFIKSSVAIWFNWDPNEVPAHKETNKVLLWNKVLALYVKVLELLFAAPTHNGGYPVSGKFGDLFSG